MTKTLDANDFKIMSELGEVLGLVSINFLTKTAIDSTGNVWKFSELTIHLKGLTCDYFRPVRS